MTYDHFFSAALARLHEERRYRVFLPISSGSPGAFRAQFGIPRTDLAAW